MPLPIQQGFLQVQNHNFRTMTLSNVAGNIAFTIYTQPFTTSYNSRLWHPERAKNDSPKIEMAESLSSQPHTWLKWVI